jgi:galactose mutarotase-like enzyme
MTLDTVQITSLDGSTVAWFAPEAGMVCASLWVDGSEQLDRREGLDAYATKGSTMGIPLLYPWANRLGARSFETLGKRIDLPEDPKLIHADGSGTPIHGIVPSLMRWDAERSDDGATLSATLSWTDPQLLELFPFMHELEFRAQAEAGELTIAVEVSSDTEDVPVSFGFHPYLKLAGAPREQWTVVLPPCDGLELDARMLPTGRRTHLPTQSIGLAYRAFDDAYELITPRTVFTARAAERTIAVEFGDGYRYAQVFSPPGAEFVCFEPMTSPSNALIAADELQILPAGQHMRATFKIKVS